MEPFVLFDPAVDDPLSLVSAILLDGNELEIEADSVVFAGAAGQSSFYDGSLTDLEIGAGILLTSGEGNPPQENTDVGFGVLQDGNTDAELQTVADAAFEGAGDVLDANTLTFSFVIDDPEVESITFDLVFGSDEFPEFSDTSFVDVGGVFVNGENVALFNNDPAQPLSIIEGNLAIGNFTDNEAGILPIEYDGISSVLTIVAPVEQGENTITFGVADTGDQIFDSGLFVANLAPSSIAVGGGSGVLLEELGTADSDILTSSDLEADLDEFFDAGDGDDDIAAGAGDDVVVAGLGNDTIDPGAGNDTVDAGPGDDTIVGDGVTPDDNQVDGGEGTDTVVYSGNFADFEISVANTFTNGTPQLVVRVGSSTDTLTNVESLEFADQTIAVDTFAAPTPTDPDFLSQIASFEAEAEIVAFDPSTNQLFSVAGDPELSVTDFSDPTNPVALDPIDLTGLGLAVGGANSVAVSGGIVAVALENEVATDNGFVAFLDSATGALLNAVDAGALPDNLTFTPDGQTVLVANEGESNGVDDEGEDNNAPFSDDPGFINPEGSISVIDLAAGVENATVAAADFSAFNDQIEALVGEVEGQGVRFADAVIDGDITVAQDLEPEFITVAPDGTTAFVALQENNAIAVVDIAAATVTDILPLGAIDFSEPGNGIDGSNVDEAIAIANIPAFGLLQPDAIAAFETGGEAFFITANEGDGRDEVVDLEDLFAGDYDIAPVAETSVTSVLLDTDLLAVLGIGIAGTSDDVLPGAIEGSIGFEILDDSDFAFTFDNTTGTFAPAGGNIEHVGTITFDDGPDNPVAGVTVGNFSIGFDATRASEATGATGFFVADTVLADPESTILFDIALPAGSEVSIADNAALQIAGADLLVSNVFADLLGDAGLVGADVGDAQIDTAVAPQGLTLDPALVAQLGPDLLADLENLEVSSIDGDGDGDGDLDELFALGSRSFSIFSASGELVFNSGDDIEQITAAAIPEFFNTDDEENTFDDRSDDAGPEPEGVVVGNVGDRTVAFIALERIGGILAYDVTDPANAEFLQYINTREFTDAAGNPLPQESDAVGDSSPEGLTFLAAEDSPTGEPLLVVAYEVSGTVGVFSVADLGDPDPEPDLEAPQGTNAINLAAIGTFQTGIFDEGAAEIVAFDAASERLFVINSDANVIDILNLADPTSPSLIESIDLGAGAVNSISVSNGIIAAAVANEDDTATGSVIFLDIDGNPLNTVPVGVLPDNVAFSADGSFAVVANEGEAVGVEDANGDEFLDVDPEGSISVIDLSGGVGNATVATADFTAFNGREEDLRGDGVRIFPGRTVAEDLEPEFVAIAPDGTQAFVSLQENNAVALVDLADLANPSVTDILPLGVTDFSQGLPVLEGIFDVPLETEEFQIGTDAEGNPIFLGGLSSLSFDGFSDAGNPLFLAINDRGPVNGTLDTDDPNSSDRPFITPDLQVTVLTLELDEAAGTVTVADSFGLTRNEGETSLPVTGLTNIPGFFEIPIDAATGEPVPNDPFGLDSEGIVRDPETGNLYVADESAPSISVFSPEGVLVDRFVPAGYADQGDDPDGGLDFNAGDFGTETLPEVYLNRRGNRGFEGLAFDDEAGILYGFIQTPLSNPDTDTSNDSSVLRILGIDPATGAPVEEFVYLLQTPAAVSTDPEVGFGSQEVDRIGDAVFAGDGQFFVIERDNEDTDDAQQFIFSIDLQGATNILGTELANATEGATLESLSPDELAAAGIQAVDKVQVTNLPSLGYSPTPQAEGLALLPDGRLAVLNDNDYEGPASPTQLGIVGFGPSNGLDASDEDGGINIDNEPAFGLFQPDTIAAFEAEGETFFITANEGDGRDSFEDLTDIARVSELTLDPEAFPDAATLQLDENLGRLEVSTIDGDIDGDGDFDRLFAFGTRSFSIRDSLGNLVFDSGDDFERITAAALPAEFNSNNDENDSFDNRSDDGGPEPEGLAIGEVEGTLYAFIGFERIGGIAVYDISDPANSEFVQYVNNRDFTVDAQLPDESTNPAVGDLGPEGLAFIAAEDSPTGEPLLAVGNEVSGTTTLFAISAALAPRDLVAGTLAADNVAIAPFGDGNFVATDASADDILTGAGDDEVDLALAEADAGDNIVLTGSDADTVFPSVGDTVLGGSGADTFATGAANGGNRIFGGAGDDTFVIAGSGDRLLGGDGADTFLASGDGDNVLSGGAGSDTFLVVDDAGAPAAANTITDFEIGIDVLQVAASAFGEDDLSLAAGSSDLVLAGNVVASLSGVDVASLTVGDDIAFI